MKKINLIILICIFALIGVLYYLHFQNNDRDANSPSKIVVIDNAKVFVSFQMKKDFDLKIENDLKFEKEMLDSLDRKIRFSKSDNLELKREFQIISQNMSQKFDQLSNKYTSEVYIRLNEYIKKFGEKNNYQLIVGSNGQGNIMYLKKEIDVTDKLIKFINEEYSK